MKVLFFILLAVVLKGIDLAMMALGPFVFVPAYLCRHSVLNGGNGQVVLVHFPWWAWPWDNRDHGIDGGNFYAEEMAGKPYWLRCLRWTCDRNPTFNLGKYLLGIKFRPYYHVGSKHPIGDKVAGGWSFCWTDLGHFELYVIVPYTDIDLLTGEDVKRCIRIRAGWKMFNKHEGDKCQFCFVPNPCMTYSGN